MRAIALPLLLLVVAPSCASAPARGPAPDPAPAPPPAAAPAPAPSPAPASTSAAPTAAASLTDADRVEDAKAANDFTTRLYAKVRRAPGNVMISGTSVRQALGIVTLGAAKDTEREMATALAFPTERARRSAVAIAETLAWEEARGSAELKLANRIWIEQSFTVKPDFTAAANAAFGAGVASVDFAHGSDAARRTINTWASDATAHKIDNLLAEGAVDPRTRLVIANALYFKARWSSTFPANATKTEPFTGFAASGASAANAGNGAKTDVSMMHETSMHRFARTASARVLEMRYDGSQLSMLLVLPDDPAPAALAKLEESLSGDTFASWTSALQSSRVNVSLPRFKFEAGGPLEPALQELGMRTAFGAKADFSGIAEPANGERLQITRVVQRTYVSVDENGTEAAAATGAGMSVTAAVLGPIADFKADHPFLFFVYDASRGRILFAGRVTAPRS
jgi:serpin B